MSAFVVEDHTINLILGYVAWRAQVGRHVPGLRSLGYDGTRPADMERLGNAMFALNVAAVEARYGTGEARTFRPLDYQPETILAVDGKPPTLEQISDALGSWHYQCAEGTVPDEPLWQTFSALKPVLEAEAEAEVVSRAKTDREAAELRRQALVAKGKPLFETAVPPWAKAVIIAHQEIDKCDSQSDYYATADGDWHILGWSKHTRDLFSEMRKAAARFEPTAHLGPGKDRWTSRVVVGRDFQDNGAYYGAGQPSHWHGELYPNGRAPEFPTEAEARAYIRQAGEPAPVIFSGQTTPFRWEIDRHSIEHREKYSMGAGYYLKASGTYSTGWKVEKETLGAYGIERLYEAFGAGRVHLGQPRQAAMPTDQTAIRAEIARLTAENARLRGGTS
mgnify:CR=1 FL=1